MLHNLFQFGFAGLAGICLLGALLRRAHRGSFVTAAICAASAAVAAHYGVFWALAVFGLGVPWALFTATSFIDLAWRAKTGMVIFLALGAALCIYPTAHDEHPRRGRPEQALLRRAHRAGDGGPQRREGLRRRSSAPTSPSGWCAASTSRAASGSSTRSTSTRRSRTSATATTTSSAPRSPPPSASTPGTRPPSVEELTKLPTKVKVAKSKDQAGTITLTFNDAADAKKVDDDFLKRFLSELQLQRSVRPARRSPSASAARWRASIRESAVTQAKETVHRRIDSWASRRPRSPSATRTSSSRSPARTSAQFAEIRDIISQTARLEFKMVDDDTDFFERRGARREDLPKGLTFAHRERARRQERQRARPGARPTTTRASTGASTRTCADALKRLKEWVSTLNVDPRSRDRLREGPRLQRGEGRVRGHRLAHLLPVLQGRDHRRHDPRRQRRAGRQRQGPGRLARARWR